MLFEWPSFSEFEPGSFDCGEYAFAQDFKNMAWISLCHLDELAEASGKYVEVDGFHLAVFLYEKEISVIDSTCPHAGANLADGHIEDGCAVCPWHSWAFRLDNGQLNHSPGIAVQKYKSRICPHDGRELVQAELPVY